MVRFAVRETAGLLTLTFPRHVPGSETSKTEAVSKTEGGPIFRGQLLKLAAVLQAMALLALVTERTGWPRFWLLPIGRRLGCSFVGPHMAISLAEMRRLVLAERRRLMLLRRDGVGVLIRRGSTAQPGSKVVQTPRVEAEGATLLPSEHVIALELLAHLLDYVESSCFADAGQVVQMGPNLFRESLEGGRVLSTGVELV